MEGLAAMEQALIKRTDISRIEQCPKERQNWRTSKNRSKNHQKKIRQLYYDKKRRFNSSPQNAVFLSEPAINT